MIVTKDGLTRKSITNILKFINSILQPGNHVPTNYNKLLKEIKPDENTIVKACKICCCPSDREICEKESCQKQRTKKTIIKKYIHNNIQPVAIIFDLKSQLRNLIIKEYDNIMDYKSKHHNFV
jgi:hypothetical protein